MEALDDLVDRGVEVEVVLFDVVDQRDGRMMMVEGPIELAGFGHEDPGPVAGRRVLGTVGQSIRADP